MENFRSGFFVGVIYAEVVWFLFLESWKYAEILGLIGFLGVFWILLLDPRSGLYWTPHGPLLGKVPQTPPQARGFVGGFCTITLCFFITNGV